MGLYSEGKHKKYNLFSVTAASKGAAAEEAKTFPDGVRRRVVWFLDQGVAGFLGFYWGMESKRNMREIFDSLDFFFSRTVKIFLLFVYVFR